METLVAKDSRYLRDHNDVVRAFRWLWRTKGRHLRLQHEESMPPRFHDESKMLASFLVNYSKAFPSDVDVLFELIRIFLQPTTSDFTFVRNFLARTVSSVLTIERKMLAGEGSEETKVLSIQLIVLPMFSNEVVENQDGSQGELPDTKQGVSDKAESTASSASSLGKNDVLDSAMTHKFVWTPARTSIPHRLRYSGRSDNCDHVHSARAPTSVHNRNMVVCTTGIWWSR